MALLLRNKRETRGDRREASNLPSLFAPLLSRLSPLALLLLRHSPEIDIPRPAVVRDGHRLLRWPVSHVVPVGDDAGPRGQLAPQPRAQLEIQLRPEEQHDDGGAFQIRGEQILVTELDARHNAFLARI